MRAQLRPDVCSFPCWRGFRRKLRFFTANERGLRPAWRERAGDTLHIKFRSPRALFGVVPEEKARTPFRFLWLLRDPAPCASSLSVSAHSAQSISLACCYSTKHSGQRDPLRSEALHSLIVRVSAPPPAGVRCAPAHLLAAEGVSLVQRPRQARAHRRRGERQPQPARLSLNPENLTSQPKLHEAPKRNKPSCSAPFSVTTGAQSSSSSAPPR